MSSPSFRPLVVCVDDEPGVLASLRRSLRNEPYDVLTTDHPEDALEWAGTHNVSVVISDQRMPRMTGVELMAALRRRSPGTARILLTGYPDSALAVDRAGLQLECLILKPWDDLELRRRIRGILDARKRHAGSDPGRAIPSDAEPPATRIDCGGMASAEVLARIVRSCTRALSSGERPTIVLQNLGSLGDSLGRLLRGMTQLAEEAGTTITLYDDSGFVVTYLRAVGGGAPFEVRNRLPG